MGKIGILVWGVLIAAVGTHADDTVLKKRCLACHIEQKIPSDLIYRRYLMRYSTPDRIEKAMLAYLRSPQRTHSIMPPQFFLKFPMKPPTTLDEERLKEAIRAYISTYDIRKRLRLNPSQQ